jgi:hypothetical protein
MHKPFFLLSVALLGAAACFARESSANIVVRFRPELIRLSITEEKHQLDYELRQILNADGLALLKKLGSDGVLNPGTPVEKSFLRLAGKTAFP